MNSTPVGKSGGVSSVREHNPEPVMMKNENGKDSSSNSSDATYEDEFPSLAASMSAAHKSKRRTRIDLSTQSQQRSEKGVENIGAPSRESIPVPSFVNEKDENVLPTSFGKNPLPPASRSPKLRENYSESGGSKRYSHNEFGGSNRYPHNESGGSKRYPHNEFGGSKRYPHGEAGGSKRYPHGESGGSKRYSHKGNRVDTDETFDICLFETKEQNGLGSSLQEESHQNVIQIGRSIESTPANGQLLRPGMVLFKNYVPVSEQVEIVRTCRELGLGPGGFYRPGYQDGAKLRLYMMCLGLDWNPETKRYTEMRLHDNARPPAIPDEFSSLVGRVLDHSQTLIKNCTNAVNVSEDLPKMSPDVCIVNFYTTNGRLGLHQDRDETKRSLAIGYPVVSLSIGDSAEFLYGDQRDIDEAEPILLESGDMLIFGGKSRHIFHGVKSIIPDTAPPALMENAKLRPGRLNLTFRKY